VKQRGVLLLIHAAFEGQHSDGARRGQKTTRGRSISRLTRHDDNSWGRQLTDRLEGHGLRCNTMRLSRATHYCIDVRTPNCLCGSWSLV